MSIEYCSTKAMIADFFAKPLQGIMSTKFCNLIMNVDPLTIRSKNQRSVLGIDGKHGTVLSNGSMTDVRCGVIQPIEPVEAQHNEEQEAMMSKAHRSI
jgi:hypothetical protein